MTSVPKLPLLKEKPAFTLNASLSNSTNMSQNMSQKKVSLHKTQDSTEIGTKKRVKRSSSSCSNHSADNSISQLAGGLDMNIDGISSRSNSGTNQSTTSTTRKKRSSESKTRITKLENHEPISSHNSGRATISEGQTSNPSSSSSSQSVRTTMHIDSLSNDFTSSDGIDFQTQDKNVNNDFQTYGANINNKEEHCDIENSAEVPLDEHNTSINSSVSSENENDDTDAFSMKDLTSTFITAVAEDSLPDDLAEEREMQRKEIEEALNAHKNETEELRKQLFEFLDDVKAKTDEDGQPLVEFPQAYDSIIEFLKDSGNYADIPNEIVKQFIDASSVADEEAMSEITEGDDLDTGMYRIRKLDLLLHQSELKSKSLQKKVQKIIRRDKKNARLRKDQKIPLRKLVLSNKDENKEEGDSTSAEETEVDNESQVDQLSDDLPFPEEYYYLSKYQQERLEKLLSDENIELGIIPPGEGFNPTPEDLERMKEIDAKLREMDPEMFTNLETGLDELEANENEQYGRSSVGKNESLNSELNKDDNESNIQHQNHYPDDEHSTDFNDTLHPYHQALNTIDEKISKLYKERDSTMPALTEEQTQLLLQEANLQMNPQT